MEIYINYEQKEIFIQNMDQTGFSGLFYIGVTYFTESRFHAG
jgi:hypothetical protein